MRSGKASAGCHTIYRKHVRFSHRSCFVVVVDNCTIFFTQRHVFVRTNPISYHKNRTEIRRSGRYASSHHPEREIIMKKRVGFIVGICLFCILLLVSSVSGAAGNPDVSSPGSSPTHQSSTSVTNWSQSPTEIHSGDIVTISFDHRCTFTDRGNISLKYSTGLINPQWDIFLSINNSEVQYSRFTGNPVQSPPTNISVRAGDTIVNHIVLNAEAPHVTKETSVMLAGTGASFWGEESGFGSSSGTISSILP